MFSSIMPQSYKKRTQCLSAKSHLGCHVDMESVPVIVTSGTLYLAISYPINRKSSGSFMASEIQAISTFRRPIWETKLFLFVRTSRTPYFPRLPHTLIASSSLRYLTITISSGFRFKKSDAFFLSSELFLQSFDTGKRYLCVKKIYVLSFIKDEFIIFTQNFLYKRQK